MNAGINYYIVLYFSKIFPRERNFLYNRIYLNLSASNKLDSTVFALFSTL